MTPLYYKDERGDQLICLDAIKILTLEEALYLTLYPTESEFNTVEIDKLCLGQCNECKDYSCGAMKFMEDDSR